jgi:hypothetical protein
MSQEILNHIADLQIRLKELQQRRRALEAIMRRSEEKYTAIIVEPRKHRALEFVLRNVLDNLDEKWSVRIYHGTENENWLREILETKFGSELSRISSENLGVANLKSSQDYSKIFTTRSFLEGIPTETFLVFQTDSMINPAHRGLIHKFMQYDYVGAPWPWDFLKVGNGGFSLRKRSMMLKILDIFGPYNGAFEDQFYSKGCDILKAHKPTAEEAREFAIEQIYHPYSFGQHKSWIHQPAKKEELCNQCEGLETLIQLQSIHEDPSTVK